MALGGGREKSEAADALAEFCERVAVFLDKVAADLPDRRDGKELRKAVKEFRGEHLKNLHDELRVAAKAGQLEPAGLTGAQLNFKLGSAMRGMDEARADKPSVGKEGGGKESKRRRWLRNAIGKVKVVLGSLRGLSKWVEALIELVEMAEKALGDPEPT